MRKIKPNPQRGRVAPRPTEPGFRMTETGWRSPCGNNIPFGKVQEFLRANA